MLNASGLGGWGRTACWTQTPAGPRFICLNGSYRCPQLGARGGPACAQTAESLPARAATTKAAVEHDGRFICNPPPPHAHAARALPPHHLRIRPDSRRREARTAAVSARPEESTEHVRPGLVHVPAHGPETHSPHV